MRKIVWTSPRKVDRCLGITQLFPRQRVSGIPVVNEASG